MIWIGRLISLAVILQSIESLFIPPWPWEIVSREFPKALRPILRNQNPLLGLRIFAALVALLWPNWGAVGILVLTSWLVAWRWRGTLNGGSDTMTMQILLAWFVSLTDPSLENICVAYVAIQIVLSYFVAGVAKVVRAEWRNGQALKKFLAQYEMASIPAPLALSWCVIFFELLFPLAMFAPWPFVMAGLIFHLLNAYVLGLNRFFFAWIAGYPAVFLLAALLR